jgi:hypothetical protein
VAIWWDDLTSDWPTILPLIRADFGPYGRAQDHRVAEKLCEHSIRARVTGCFITREHRCPATTMCKVR